MTGWLSGLLIVAIAALLTLAPSWWARAHGKEARKPQARPQDASTDHPSAAAVVPLSRDEIARRLRKLSEMPAPPTQILGAMCYEPMAPASDQVRYVCPVDGTVVVFPVAHAQVARHAQRIRQQLAEVRDLGLDVSLDESDLCPKCRGSRPVTSPALTLVVRYPGEAQVHRYAQVLPEDVDLLREFLAGETVHRLSGPDTEPMRKWLSRLQELLGANAMKTVSAATLSRDELSRRLSALPAKSTKELQPGAMCYKMAAPPATNDYICPVDGSRTHYTKGENSFLLSGELPDMRAAVERIKAVQGGPAVSLDESDLCRRCKPSVKNPQITLVVRSLDGKEHRTPGINAEDLALLADFLEGKTVYRGQTGQESLIKSHEKRLRELLGL
jgi:hypothetical protein